jgi:hypothetical protein
MVVALHTTAPLNRIKQNKTTCSRLKPVGAKGFELRSSRADTLSAQGKARAINLYHIGSTPYYVSNAYATTMNVIELQEAERAEGFCLIRQWWVLAHNNRRIKQNKTTVVVCSASCKPYKQKKDD